MDSITQAALGAAVGEAVLGRKIGRKASAWGAALGTFPDLDVFIPMGDPISNFVYHRSFSHSIFLLALMTPLWVWILRKVHSQLKHSKWATAATVYAIFITHVIIDSFTVYGTQVFWPLSFYPVSIGSVFIVDPLYTLPLLVGIFVYLLTRGNLGYRANRIGLTLSSAYLLWSLFAQAHVYGIAKRNLHQEQDSSLNLLVTPTPFNTVLWRIVYVTAGGYEVGYYSLLDPDNTIRFRRIDDQKSLLEGISNWKSARQIKWFTHGFYTVEPINEKIVISDIRMGIEPNYVFQFDLGPVEASGRKEVKPIRYIGLANIERIKNVWDRIWDPNVEI